MIAHRLSTVKNADNIVVLTNGQIAEQGRHAELIANGAIYSKLVEAQTLENKPSTTEKKSVEGLRMTRTPIGYVNEADALEAAVQEKHDVNPLVNNPQRLQSLMPTYLNG
jgi:ABC-type microcin C transport system duplicated ATPase subunit YejF